MNKLKINRAEKLIKLKVANLKVLLSDNGVSINGNKKSLIEQILNYEYERKVSNFNNLISLETSLHNKKKQKKTK